MLNILDLQDFIFRNDSDNVNIEDIGDLAFFKGMFDLIYG